MPEEIVPTTMANVRIEEIYVTLKRTPLDVARRHSRHIQRYVTKWAASKGYVAGSIRIFRWDLTTTDMIRGVTIAPTRAAAYAIRAGNHGVDRERLDDMVKRGVRGVSYPVISAKDALNT